jgi:hypothetical protein
MFGGQCLPWQTLTTDTQLMHNLDVSSNVMGCPHDTRRLVYAAV